VTQVAGPLEGHVFHNRLTHTIKVAQIARRLAERVARQRKLSHDIGGIDPEVVEAAALAHDLGHPPFGHIAENELDRLVRLYGDEEGYEGNAQSFRIVTRLAAHQPGYEGLNLTRATLNAILKYPWSRDLQNIKSKEHKKYGYYKSEEKFFKFARDGYSDARQSPEAALMDIADAIAYSVHDLDDFFRAGLVPLYLLRFSSHEFEWFLDDWKANLKGDIIAAEIDASVKHFRSLLEFWPTEEQFVGSHEQRRYLRWATSKLIDRYVRSVAVRRPDSIGRYVFVQRREEIEMAFLQRLVRRYVIDNPRLATQQAGQRRIIRTLYTAYHRAIRGGNLAVIPAAFDEAAAKVQGIARKEVRRLAEARTAADIVASLSDAQANVLFRRLSGVTPGSVSDLLDG
jgi:dGTPase